MNVFLKGQIVDRIGQKERKVAETFKARKQKEEAMSVNARVFTLCFERVLWDLPTHNHDSAVTLIGFEDSNSKD